MPTKMLRKGSIDVYSCAVCVCVCVGGGGGPVTPRTPPPGSGHGYIERLKSATPHGHCILNDHGVRGCP